MVAAYRETQYPSQLALTDGWRPHGAESAFIKEDAVGDGRHRPGAANWRTG